MSTPTDTGPHHIPTPPGWPGDDPTVPDELGALGVRPLRHPARPSRRHLPAYGREDVEAEPSLEPRPELGPVAAVEVDEEPVRRVAVDAPDGDDDPGRGLMPAGRVLVILVAALLLAALINADALVAKAEQQPLGPERDRALAVWRPVQDVSHVLQLYRVRQVADWAAGNDHAHRGGSAAPKAAAPASHTSPTTTAATGPGTTAAPSAPAAPAALRTPTRGKPLRLWVGGDSLAQVFGQSMVNASQATGLIAPKLHYEISSGLARPDFYDWPGALADDVKAGKPEVVVLMLGANDAQGLVLPSGTAVPDVSDPRWSPEYRRRVGAIMDQLKADGRLVVWVGQPPMRGATFDARMKIVDAAYAAEAAKRPWVVYVDPAKVVGDAQGRFADLIPGPDGKPQDVRQDDGIHFTRAGGDRLAAHVLALVEDRAGIKT
ncbi:MAG TPA: DUF459 domain-containing protein [Acidimicrobiales bacterium]|nr:DUF459 domain-containing protein [Acidimicrobiales bacterium]